MSCDKLSKDYYNYFLGNTDNLEKKIIFDYFDINYLPLKNLPIVYFSMNDINMTKLKSLNLTDESFISLINDLLIKINSLMDNKDNNYNTFNIYYMCIILCFFLIIITISFLRIIQYKYPLYYTYILIGIIIILLLVTSLWFLYVNTSIL